MADGTTGPDTFNGTSADEVYNGLAGNDTIYSGGGLDQLSGNEDNDTIILNAAVTNGSTFNGGDGTDTLELHSDPTAPVAYSWLAPNGIQGTFFNFFLSTATSFEKIDFRSDAGVSLSGAFALGGTSTSISELIGGNGWDQLILVASAPTAGQSYAFTAPTFTFTGWTGADRAYRQADRVTLISTGPGDVTFNASAHQGVMHIGTGSGDDVLNGSDDMETLNGGGGVNDLHGGGGSDGLIISNNVTNDGSGNPGAPTAFTGENSTFDGGAGLDDDFLMVGGPVTFLGTIQDIEGIFLMPGKVLTAPTPFGSRIPSSPSTAQSGQPCPQT